MKVRNRIVDYLRGDGRGKEANSLEKEALNDAFLYEALEGLAGTQRDAVRDIEGLSRWLQKRTRSRWSVVGKMWGMVAAVVVIGFGIWVGFRQIQRGGECQQGEALSLAGSEILEQETAGEGSDTGVMRGEAEQRQVAGSPDSVRMVLEPEFTDSSASALPVERDSVAEGNSGSVPFGGYEKFYRYIRDSLRYPQDALERGLEGEIKLSFYVNKAGRPSHIRVVKWITYSCNREAIRLLSEGPAWNYTGDTSYVVIPFRLKKQ